VSGKDLQVSGNAGAGRWVMAGDGQEGLDGRVPVGVAGQKMAGKSGNLGDSFCIIIRQKIQGIMANKWLCIV
jgi:hypothetical protein